MGKRDELAAAPDELKAAVLDKAEENFKILEEALLKVKEHLGILDEQKADLEKAKRN